MITLHEVQQLFQSFGTITLIDGDGMTAREYDSEDPDDGELWLETDCYKL